MSSRRRNIFFLNSQSISVIIKGPRTEGVALINIPFNILVTFKSVGIIRSD
jgi:hypothetical protein